MYKPKTQRTSASVAEFIARVPDDKRRADAQVIVDMIQRVTGLEPYMWGPSIIGYGHYHYRYESGHEGNAGLTGFSPRKDALVVYVVPGFTNYQDLMTKLGKHKTGKSCLYIKSLQDVDLTVLAELISRSVEDMKKKYH